MNEILKALALEFGDYRTFGYKVEPLNPTDGSLGWMLFDPDGHSLQIGTEGGLAKRKESAILEAYRRIAQDAPGGVHVALRDVYREARDLLTEPGDNNPEYDRGLAELVAALDARDGLPLNDRAAEVLAELRSMEVPA